MPSFVLKVPGPGAYNPNPMQKEGATQYRPHTQMWRPERYAATPSLAETAGVYETAAAATQRLVDADNKARAELMRVPTSKPFVTTAPHYQGDVSRPPHKPGAWPTVTPSVMLRPMAAVLDRTAGSASACYPAVPSVARPGYTPPLSALISRPATAAGPLVSLPPTTVAAGRGERLLSSGVATSAEHRALRLLNKLHGVSRSGVALPDVPVLPHDRRKPSAERGLSRAALRALRTWAVAHECGQRSLGDLCFGEGSGSLCAITRHTGLSLVETLALLADELGPRLHPQGPLARRGLAMSAGSGVAVPSAAVLGDAGIVGYVTTLVSCEDDPARTTLLALLDALEQLCSSLDRAAEANGAEEMVRYLWIEPFALSPNLVAGHFVRGRADPAAASSQPFEDAEGARAQAEAAAIERFVFRGGKCAAA